MSAGVNCGRWRAAWLAVAWILVIAIADAPAFAQSSSSEARATAAETAQASQPSDGERREREQTEGSASDEEDAGTTAADSASPDDAETGPDAAAPADAEAGADATAPAEDQAGEPSAGDPATEAGAGDGTPGMVPGSVEQLAPETARNAIQVLEDDAARTQLLETLRAIAAVQQSEAPEEQVSNVVAQPVHWLQREIDARVSAVQTSIDAVLQSGTQLEYFLQWIEQQALEESRRVFWLETLSSIGVIIGVAVAAALVLRRLLRSTRARFEAYAPPTPLHVVGAILLHAVVRILPIALFVLTAAALMFSLNLGAYTAAVTRSLVEGLAFVTAVTAVMRAVYNVRNPHLRLLPVDEATALSVQRSSIRVLAVGGYGYFGLQAARALGLPWTLHGFLEHVLFFITFLFFVRLVLRFRRLGADGLRSLAASHRGGVTSRFLPWQSIAASWHIGAILFGLAIYLSWALEIADGPAFLFRALGITIGLLFLTRLVNVWLTARALDREPTRQGDDEDDAEPADLLGTVRRSPGAFFLRLGVTTLAFVLILQAWGFDVLGLLRSETGEAVRSAMIAAGLTLAIALVVWKIVSRVILGAIEETDNLGRPVRSSRSQTLLTIGRNFAFVLIWFTGSMLALSELGVNLAPLIAGAGVIGLAVGFGAQTLVQDIITGFFILLEDTIAVGDVADLGGKVGVVEAVTLRIVRLRGYDGQVHTIPYSKISTISNLTKDFSYYVFDVGVAYKEDVDRVMAVMSEVGAAMQRERTFRRLIVEPIEIAGVDRFAESAVVIKARLKTRPLQQWTVGREYNRRLKKRFDELGIEIPFPQRTLHVAAPAVPAPSFAPTPAPRTPAADDLATNAAESR